MLFISHFPGLARSNRYGQQITKLITSATAVSAYPIYAFYSAANTVNGCGGVLNNKNGSYLCGADLVDQQFVKVRTNVSDIQVISKSYPMPCIACCALLSGNSALSLIEQIHRYFPISKLSQTTDNHLLGFLEDIPPYINLVLYNDSKFSEEFQDVNAIVIVDNRD